jgi:serine/threonine protein kinase
VLYEMLTLRRPFEGETDEETLERARTGLAPRLSEISPDLADLDDLVMRAIAPDPKQRYARASDLQVAIAQSLFARNAGYGSPELATWMREVFGWEILEEQRDGTKSLKDRLLYQLSRAQIVVDGAQETKELLSMRTVSIPSPELDTGSRSRRSSRFLLEAGLVVVLVGMLGTAALLFAKKSPPPMPSSPAQKRTSSGAVAGFGNVSINSWPSATVYLDGVRLPGSTPILHRKVSAGIHKFVFEHSTLGLKKEVVVDVSPDTDRTVAVTLDR